VRRAVTDSRHGNGGDKRRRPYIRRQRLARADYELVARCRVGVDADAQPILNSRPQLSPTLIAPVDRVLKDPCARTHLYIIH